LPDRKEFGRLLKILLLFYLVFGILIRPEALPGLVPQAVIWIFYIGLYKILRLNLKKPAEQEPAAENSMQFKLSWRKIFTLTAIFSLSSAFWSLSAFKGISLIIMWLGFIFAGIYCLGASIRNAFKRNIGQNNSLEAVKYLEEKKKFDGGRQAKNRNFRDFIRFKPFSWHRRSSPKAIFLEYRKV
jgi:hypothetical protein